MRNSLMFAFCIAMVWFHLTAATAQAQASFETRAQVGEKTGTFSIPYPEIDAYDLSPDGARLALLVVSGDPMQAPVPAWVVIVSAINAKVLNQVRFGTRAQWVPDYASQIAFTADGMLLVVEDGQQTVSVLDAATLATVRTFAPERGSRFNVPVSIVTAANSPLVAISFGTGAPVTNYLNKFPVHTMIVDASNGEQVASWDADDIPFSISPNAKFVAVADHSGAGPVMGVAILDAKSGKRVTALSGGYPSRIGEYPGLKTQFSSSIIAKFISDDEVVMTPSANADQFGSYGDADVKVVRIADAHVIQEIAPERYGPTGELAVSVDGSTFFAVSYYLAHKYFENPHWRIPSDTSAFLVFSREKQQAFRLVNRTKLAKLPALRNRGLRGTVDPRISRDGSVVAIAEDYGVTVLTRR